VLVHNNPSDSVLDTLKGIDHLDYDPIGAALFGVAGELRIPAFGP
jgi:hypothetical protein